MKFRIPLLARSVEGTSCPFPMVTLNVRDSYGTLAEIAFRVDTQADFTTIPVDRSRREHIPFSVTKQSRVVGLVGQTTAYHDRVRIVIAGREHDWPCHFVDATLTSRASSQGDLSAVLGRAGFLDEYAVAVDDGYLIVTRLGPIRRWLRRRLHQLWKWFGLIHRTDHPL